MLGHIGYFLGCICGYTVGIYQRFYLLIWCAVCIYAMFQLKNYLLKERE